MKWRSVCLYEGRQDGGVGSKTLQKLQKLRTLSRPIARGSAASLSPFQTRWPECMVEASLENTAVFTSGSRRLPKCKWESYTLLIHIERELDVKWLQAGRTIRLVGNCFRCRMLIRTITMMITRTFPIVFHSKDPGLLCTCFIVRTLPPATILDRFFPLFLISLFIERAIEVFVSAWRGTEAAIRDRQIKELRKAIKEGKGELISELARLSERPISGAYFYLTTPAARTAK